MLLETYRKRTGETIEAFAKRLGIGESSLRKKLKGGGCTVDEALVILERACGMVQLEDLKRRKPRKKRAPRGS